MLLNEIVKLPVKNKLNNHILGTILSNKKFKNIEINFIDENNMIIKIGNIYFGADDTRSTNINNVVPFTKIIYMEHANYNGVYDPNKDINTYSNLNYYHYKQTNPNDYDIQKIMIRTDRINANDKVCFFLSPGIWKAQSPKAVSGLYVSHINRSNGFYMFNMRSAMFGFGSDKTIIDMNLNTYIQYDASCIHIPTDGSYLIEGNNKTLHSYNFLKFNFYGRAYAFFSSGIGYTNSITSSVYTEIDDTMTLYECVLDFTNLQYTPDKDVYANGGEFKFYNTNIVINNFRNSLYINSSTKFTNLKNGYSYTISSYGTNFSTIYSNINDQNTITDIKKL